jgi:hypothetical protein
MIASAYGRGHWMAVELHRLGFNVQLVDVTQRLGPSLPADQDGPFGYFHSPRWAGMEGQALESLGPVQQVAYGLSLWLKSGPWELRGPTAGAREEALQQQERVLDFVKHYSELGAERKGWIEKLSELDFERRWFASLASDLMSVRSQWSTEAYLQSPPAPLFEKYLARAPESRSLEASLQWCADQGVVVTRQAEIPDLAIEHRRVQGIEINAEKSGFVRCHQLIWLLTSAETAHFSPRASVKLYKGQAMEPEWCWLRYTLELEAHREANLLPREFVLIDDLNVPWAHDNYAIFRRSEKTNQFHVWLRLPFSQRFHREYLAERIQPVFGHLEERCSRLKARLVALPPEAMGSSKELGAPLFPVFRSQDLSSPPGVSVKNLWFSHSERWPSYEWSHIYASQNQIISSLKQWWGAMTTEQKQKELQL